LPDFHQIALDRPAEFGPEMDLRVWEIGGFSKFLPTQFNVGLFFNKPWSFNKIPFKNFIPATRPQRAKKQFLCYSCKPIFVLLEVRTPNSYRYLVKNNQVSPTGLVESNVSFSRLWEASCLLHNLIGSGLLMGKSRGVFFGVPGNREGLNSSYMSLSCCASATPKKLRTKWDANLDGGFKYFLFSPLFGEDCHLDDSYFSDGLVQPPTRWCFLDFPDGFKGPDTIDTLFT